MFKIKIITIVAFHRKNQKKNKRKIFKYIEERERGDFQQIRREKHLILRNYPPTESRRRRENF